MSEQLRILVADDEPDMRDFFNKILPILGHQVVGAAENGQQLVRMGLEVQPDLIITDIKMPLLDGIVAAEMINRDRATPVILVSALAESTLLERAEIDHVMCYLVKPIKSADLGPAISLSVRQFALQQRLKRESKAHQVVAASHVAPEVGLKPL